MATRDRYDQTPTYKRVVTPISGQGPYYVHKHNSEVHSIQEWRPKLKLHAWSLFFDGRKKILSVIKIPGKIFSILRFPLQDIFIILANLVFFRLSPAAEKNEFTVSVV